MSEEPISPVAVGPSGCPIGDDFLPQNMRKHVDPKAPVPLRMMAAKGLVPLSPSDLVGALFMLTFDAEVSIRETAAKTAGGLPDRIVSSAARDEGLKPPVLGWLLGQLCGNDQYAEMLILNGTTPDEAVARVAGACSKKTAEIIGQNQLRLLRHDAIVRELAKNPVAQGALIDGVCDFAVQSGVVMSDVAQMQEARVRLFGAEAAASAPVDPGPTADEVIEEMQQQTPTGATIDAPLDETKKLTLSQRLMKMSVSEKIKLATKGNKEARTMLFRDSNKLVLVAVIRSPRITDGEVMVQAMSKVANDEVLRVIYSNREWLRQYPIKLALVRNPKVPQAVSMRLLNQLHESDLKNLARDKNVPGTVQMLAKKHTQKKEDSKGGGGH
jgi:hypothetical protein